MGMRNRPEWDDWFMALAFVVSQRSLDPATRHGCVIVSGERNVLSVGYNGPPRGQDDNQIPLTRPEKYRWFEHAESNAILNAARHGAAMNSSTLYVTGYPCVDCIRKIINVGIKEVVYGSVGSAMISNEDRAAIRKMVDRAEILVERMQTKQAVVVLQDAILAANANAKDKKNGS